MDIKSISTLPLPAANYTQHAVVEQKPENKQHEKTEEKRNFSKLPYITGAVILAGLGIYKYRTNIKRLLRNKETTEPFKREIEQIVPRVKKPDVINPESVGNVQEFKINTTTASKPDKIIMTAQKRPSLINESKRFDKNAADIVDVVPEPEQTAGKLAENLKKQVSETQTPLPSKAENAVSKTEHAAPKAEETAQGVLERVENETLKGKYMEVGAGFDENGKVIYEKVPVYDTEKLSPVKSAVEELFKTIHLKDEKILRKIADVREKQLADVNRIINENVHEGRLDRQMMNKIARDFASDKNRGETRYHQAADILEQSYIKAFIKKDGKEMTGLQNLYDLTKADSPLFEIYTKMPVEEAASRLRYLADNDLKSANYKGMNNEQFFEKSFERLVEKFQFKTYNEAHNIKPEF